MPAAVLAEALRPLGYLGRADAHLDTAIAAFERRAAMGADDPATRYYAAAAYLHVPDADALAARWSSVERTGTPVDTDYGLREGWHIDPDGNLLRFGSPIASAE